MSSINIEKLVIATYRKGISLRLNSLKKACGSLRTLSHVYLASSTGIHIDFQELISSWDSDFRPEIRGSKIKFLNVKNNQIILENGEVIYHGRIRNTEDLKRLHDYLQIMVK